MNDNHIDIAQAAASWHVRQAEMSEADWVRFVEWLEASPAHASAYDSLALDDAELGGAVDLLPSLPDRGPALAPAAVPIRPWGRRGLMIASGLAVAASAVFVVPGVMTPAAVTYATAPGEMRTVRLTDGSSMTMSGGTRIAVGQRVATLETGEALFDVRHDAAHPFTVVSGGLTLRDVGTIFDVSRDGARLDVQIAQGAVVFQPEHEGVMLRAGAALTARQDEGTLTMSKVGIDQVGGWRAGRLSFEAEPLARVGQTVQRIGGYRLEFAPGLSGRPFTGTVSLSGTAERDVPRIAELIGAKWRKDGARWIISLPANAR